MDKLEMKSKDNVQGNIEKIRGLFPNAVTEVLRDGKPTLAVDFDVLKQEMSDTLIDDKEERYQFTWPDKKKSILLANTPIKATLRPCKEESVDFDNTENLYIEGDNLDVLKLLQETYLGKIKMIYIDPPYNTGNDFVYNDDFSESAEEYKETSGQYDEQGNRLFQNTESNGRFHTDWLNMIYPRLKVAKDLLSDDGVIFIHIDDKEVYNLGKICYEIFGESNFINLLTIKTKIAGVSGSSEGKSLKDATEFIWIFSKNKNSFLMNPVYIKTLLSDKIQEYADDEKSWKYTTVITNYGNKTLLKENSTENIKIYGYSTFETQSVSTYAKKHNINEEEVYNLYADRIIRTTNAQTSVRKNVIEETQGYNYPLFGYEYVPTKGKNAGHKTEVFYVPGEDINERNLVMFLSDVIERQGNKYYYLEKISSLWEDIEYNNLSKEGEISFPNGKKPVKLIQRILELITNKNDIILDFFSGSATTAHAVMQLNTKDGGSRKFIMVQLPENLDTNLKKATSKETKKTITKAICLCDEIGVGHYVTEIGKERIRRAGKKIKEENGLTAQNLDIGFRVLKLDSSNMKDVYYKPQDYSQSILDSLESNIKEDRTPLDLLFQVMLDLGKPLSAKIKEKEIAGKKVFIVNDDDLIACFDDGITEDVVKEIAKRKPLYAVFRDSGLSSDSTSANFDQIFSTYSPNTERKVL